MTEAKWIRAICFFALLLQSVAWRSRVSTDESNGTAASALELDEIEVVDASSSWNPFAKLEPLNYSYYRPFGLGGCRAKQTKLNFWERTGHEGPAGRPGLCQAKCDQVNCAGFAYALRGQKKGGCWIYTYKTPIVTTAPINFKGTKAWWCYTKEGSAGNASRASLEGIQFPTLGKGGCRSESGEQEGFFGPFGAATDCEEHCAFVGCTAYSYSLQEGVCWFYNGGPYVQTQEVGDWQCFLNPNPGGPPPQPTNRSFEEQPPEDPALQQAGGDLPEEQYDIGGNQPAGDAGLGVPEEEYDIGRGQPEELGVQTEAYEVGPEELGVKTEEYTGVSDAEADNIGDKPSKGKRHPGGGGKHKGKKTKVERDQVPPQKAGEKHEGRKSQRGKAKQEKLGGGGRSKHPGGGRPKSPTHAKNSTHGKSPTHEKKNKKGNQRGKGKGGGAGSKSRSNDKRSKREKEGSRASQRRGGRSKASRH